MPDPAGDCLGNRRGQRPPSPIRGQSINAALGSFFSFSVFFFTYKRDMSYALVTVLLLYRMDMNAGGCNVPCNTMGERC